MVNVDLSGKTALITGATGGIGQVIARTLAHAGASVILQYHHNAAYAEALKEEIIRLGVNVLCVSCDLTQEKSVQKMRDEIKGIFPVIDIVVSGAYIPLKRQPSIFDLTAEEMDEQFQGIVINNLIVLQTFLPAMCEQKSGSFIGINSVASVNCMMTQAHYCAAKRAMDGILRSAAKSVAASGVRVNQVLPGWVKTPLERPDVNDAHYLPSIPMGHRGEAQNVADAVLFFSSDLSSFITGVQLPVCGGEIMPGM